ncbi:MAG: ACT domain-containing protein [Acidimicrobiia bacterium]
MTEFTVRLANRPGMLASLAEIIAEAGINIEALAAFGINELGVVRMMVDDAPTTRAVLRRAGIGFDEREVLITTLPHRPGALAAVARDLADAGVNIDAFYLLRSSAAGLDFAVGVDEVDVARRSMAV